MTRGLECLHRESNRGPRGPKPCCLTSCPGQTVLRRTSGGGDPRQGAAPPFFVPFLAPPAGKNFLPFFPFVVSFLQLFFLPIFASDPPRANSLGTSDLFFKIHKFKFNSARRKRNQKGPQFCPKNAPFWPKLVTTWGRPGGPSSCPIRLPSALRRSPEAGVPCEALRRAARLQAPRHALGFTKGAWVIHKFKFNCSYGYTTSNAL